MWLMGWRNLGWSVLLLCQLCVCQTPARPRSAEPANPQVYRNPDSGFCYTIPFRWVDRTKEMASDDPDARKPHSKVLLAIFERPPQAPNRDINPTVVIASEPISAYQGLKSAADYFGPLAEVASSHGMRMEGGPYQVVINNRRLARGDFTKQMNGTTVRQSTLVLLDRNSVLSFTFIAEDDEHVNSLIAQLRLGPCGRA